MAGGIGVTPLITMAHALHRRGVDVSLHCCAHDRATAPFLAELEAAPFAGRLVTQFGADGAGGRFDAAETLARPAPTSASLQGSVAAAAAALGASLRCFSSRNASSRANAVAEGCPPSTVLFQCLR